MESSRSAHIFHLKKLMRASILAVVEESEDVEESKACSDESEGNEGLFILVSIRKKLQISNCR